MDKLNALQAFVAVAEAGGFSRAARKLGMAASSLTRIVDALEAELGVALLTRTTRQVTLTDAGVEYLEQIGRILAELVEADESVAGQAGMAAGPLRVSVPVSYGRLVVGPLVPSFLAAHPHVNLDLLVSDAFLDLATERLDLAIRIGLPGRDAGLIVRELAGNRRLLVAARRYLRQAGTPTKPQELSQHECMRFSYQGGRQQWSFVADGKTEKVDVSGRLKANSLDMLHEAVLGGHGIALLPDWLVRNDLAAGTLQLLLAAWEASPQGEPAVVYACYLTNRRRSRKVQAFVHHLEQSLQRAGVS